ncbi:hypothetical protein BVRB_6g152470 [Beta vulgaris subsp. vulgaris]|nr:hypothetical protein BVRB_6g152470 [Beta vulgaris subsp. vulgaris]
MFHIRRNSLVPKLWNHNIKPVTRGWDHRVSPIYWATARTWHAPLIHCSKSGYSM